MKNFMHNNQKTVGGGRNAPCFCNSGKKYKYCCGALKLSGTGIKEDAGTKLAEVKEYVQQQGLIISPSEVTIEKCSSEVSSKADQSLDLLLSRVKKAGLGSWPEMRLKKVDEITRNLVHNTSSIFTFYPLHPESYSRLITKNVCLAGYFYWNDIDCYIHEFRTQVRRFFSDRIHAFLRNATDIPTGMAILRQVLEVTWHAISYQALISFEHSRVLRSVSELKKCNLVQHGDLEDLVMTITCVNREQVKMLGSIINKSYTIPSSHNACSSDIPNDKLFAFASYVTQLYDQSEFYDGTSLNGLVLSMRKLYKFLCQFLHPTPLLFPIGAKFNRSVDRPRDEDKELAAALSFLELVECSHCLLNNLLFSKRLQIAKFADFLFMISYLSPARKVMGEIKNPLLKNFMNRYKPEIIFQLPEGPATIFKRSGS
jgi:hypothetical protein